ncbi:MAG: replicative DNA helicase [Tissierellia bacterium]|nr:replicative DNA helicase [Tissierellia bacterium]
MSEEKKQLPNSIDSEISLLALLLADNDNLDIIMELVSADDFYDSRNKAIFETIKENHEKNISIDDVILKSLLNDKNIYQDIGADEYIAQIKYAPYSSYSLKEYANTIKAKSLLRQLIAYGQDVIQFSFDQTNDIEAVIDMAESKIYEITHQSMSKGLVKVNDTIGDTIKQINDLFLNRDNLTGVTTGLSTVDNSLSGLQSSQLVLLAARPAMGKTALGLTMAYNAAMSGKTVAFFSLEMSTYQLNQRLISMASMVELQDIITGNIEDDKWQILVEACDQLSRLNLYVDETAGISLSELRSKAKRLKTEVGLDLIVIDYLQLMTVDDKKENRQQEIATISRGLKTLSKELDCPVLSLAQLSREADKRSDHKPILSDLRESGAIEQDADVVMLLYREDYYDEEENPNMANVILAKHRNGPTGIMSLYFDKKCTTFRDISYEQES